MRSTDWGEPAPGYPGGGAPEERGWPNWLKLLLLLILLLALGWVLLLSFQYLRTGKPIGDLPGIPPPVSDLFDRVTFKYVATIEGVDTPMGVAIGPNDRIYVTEAGGQREIIIYDSLWQKVGSFAPPDTEPGSRVPVYVAVSPASGDVYVSDRANATIYVFSPDGESKGQVTAPAGFEDWHPLGLTFDEAGNLYISDVTPDKHRIIILDPDGKLKLTFGSQGEADGQFWYPNGMAVDADGHIFVADSNNGRMQAFDKDGNFLFKISRGMAPGDLSMPRGIAIDSNNRLLVADTSRGAVQAYSVSDLEGGDAASAPVKLVGSFSGDPGTATFFLFPNGMAIDGEGKIYVTDRANNRVQIWKY